MAQSIINLNNWIYFLIKYLNLSSMIYKSISKGLTKYTIWTIDITNDLYL